MIIDAPLWTDFPSLKHLWQEAFGDSDDFLNRFEETAFSPKRCRVLTIKKDTAAALYWFDCSYNDHRIAYIYAVATAKACRGQGLCHRLMADTHEHLEALGYEGALLVPGSPSLFDFYKSMGYSALLSIHEFTVEGTPKKTSLHRLTAEEYAKRRRSLLPEGSVLQEGENLTFLQTQASFFESADCLLVARREGDLLYVPELLGDLSSAPSIVNAFHAERGVFRTVGDSRPFALYRSFTGGESAPPTYFSLAFD